MQQTPFSTLRKTALLPTLIAMGLLAGCSGGGDSAANAAAPVDGDAVEARVQASAAAAAAAPADFEGTDRKSVVEGKSVSGRVDLGGRRILKKKKMKHKQSRGTENQVQHGR